MTPAPIRYHYLRGLDTRQIANRLGISRHQVLKRWREFSWPNTVSKDGLVFIRRLVCARCGSRREIN